MPENARYIAIEGPLAAGKTTLAERITRQLGARLVLDPVESNPFLADFFADPERYAFATQCHFRLSRYEQQRALVQERKDDTTFVCNYILAKDSIYAYLNLNDTELALYERIFSSLTGVVLEPDVVIFLQPEIEWLMDQLRKRSRPFERRLAQSYVEDLLHGYQTYFFRHPEIPVLIVHSEGVDFARDKEAVRDIVSEVPRMTQGTRYYVPSSKRSRRKG